MKDVGGLWLRDLAPLHILDEAGVVLASARAREVAGSQGLANEAREAFVTAVAELVRNRIVHAYGGWMDCRPIERDGVLGVEAVLADLGSGILEPVAALHGEPSTKGGLGAGFSGAYRLLDEMDVDIRRREGTCIRARKFAAPPSRRREVAIIGEPTREEAVCGDDAVFLRDGETLRFAVVDGVGHGPPAREAADLAVRSFFAAPTEPLEEILRRCDQALHQTRGAAMLLAVMRTRASAAEVEQLSVGNIELRIAGVRERSCGGRISGAVGLRHRRPQRRTVAEAIAVGAGEAIVAFTDGIPSRATLKQGSYSQPALIIASELFAQRRGDDDTLVLVAK